MQRMLGVWEGTGQLDGDLRLLLWDSANPDPKRRSVPETQEKVGTGVHVEMMPRMLVGINKQELLSWYLCPYCEEDGKDTNGPVYFTEDCPECQGTDMDTIPWSELFVNGRREGEGF